MIPGVILAQSGASPVWGRSHRSVVMHGAFRDPHELSISMTGLVGAARGAAPRSKISMRRMRPPQQGQAIVGAAEASGSGQVGGARGVGEEAVVADAVEA